MSGSPFNYVKLLISLFNFKGSCHSNCHTWLQMVLEGNANIFEELSICCKNIIQYLAEMLQVIVRGVLHGELKLLNQEF